MKRHSWLFVAVMMVFAILSAATAQHLPEGAYHSDRERVYDIIHYQAELQFDFALKQVSGSATLTLRMLRNSDTFALDAIGLNVHSVVEAATGKALAFASLPAKLKITLPQAKGPQDTIHVVVQYDARPTAGMYFQPDQKNPRLMYISTYGENGLHANWLPIYNDVNDKFSSEMLVTVPPPYVVISNGVLVDTGAQPNGEKTFHWLQQKPHSSYLITLYIGDYEKGDLRPAFGMIPIGYWVPRGELSLGAPAFRNTTDMVEFFSNRFDYRYPWDKYDQVAVPDYAIGAMEHTGVTGHRANVLRDQNAPIEFDPSFDEYAADWNNESIISHELAHHWFGDNLTCRNLSYIWLNESFASYLMMLWDEQSLGRDQLLFDVQLAKKHYLDYVHKAHIIRPLEYHYFDDANTIYNTEHTYLKGAAILHMLRQIVGDEAYFRALSAYLHKHEFANVVSNDLQIAFEEAVGLNLDWFFADWVTGGGHPVYEVHTRYLADRKLLQLDVEQIQPLVDGQDLFELPVRLTIATPGATWQERVWVEQASEQYFFPCETKPLMVSFDGEGDLVAEVRFAKEVDELVYQATHDALPGSMWAVDQLAARFPTDAKTVKTMADLISGKQFWGLQAEAALQLGKIRTAPAEQAAAQALAASDYHVRKAAVLALPRFGTKTAEQKLLQVIDKDRHLDVVATAIVALAKMNPTAAAGVAKKQISRSSWYDELAIACLRAYKEIGDPANVATIKKYTAENYNQNVRQGALEAWEASAPTDKELHKTLIGLLRSPVYSLQQYALGAVGRLYVGDAEPVLSEIVAEDADANLVTAAQGALESLEGIDKEQK